METAKKALSKLSRGHATILWGRVVLRVGDRFTVGETISIYAKGVTIDEAAAILAVGQ